MEGKAEVCGRHVDKVNILGGLFPGLVLYLSSFYPREMLHIRSEQTSRYIYSCYLDTSSRIATFFSSASLSGAFSGLLAAAIDQMNGIGGKPGWAWIFILVSVVL